MENNCIEEFPSSNNFRSVNFTYNNINYEINTSLYSNAIIISSLLYYFTLIFKNEYCGLVMEKHEKSFE